MASIKWVLALGSIISSTSLASMDWGAIESRTWKNPLCQTGTPDVPGILSTQCELEEFNLRHQEWVADYTDRFPDEAQKLGDRLLNYGATVFYEYKTTSPAALENYVTASFIRGCMYRTQKNPDGSIESTHIFIRDLLDRKALFLHRDWTVDSIDSDPMYKNEFAEKLAQDPLASRHGRWEWTADTSSFDQDQAIEFGDQKPSVGRLFTSDRPGTAFRMNAREAKNVSLEFRICLYPAGQVPKTITEANHTDFGTPLACHEWSHSKVFNYVTKKFDSPTGIQPICQGDPVSSLPLIEEGGAYYYQN